MHLIFALDFALHGDLSDADLNFLGYRYWLFLCKHVFGLQDVLKTSW